jgi:tetratricopeptide (TPR) repeat protein
MLSPALALLAAILTSVLLQAIHLVRSTSGTILPAVAVLITVLILLLRRTSQRVEPLVKEAEKHVIGGRVELGIKTLEGGLRWGRWHPLVPGQLRSMIGTLYFDTGKLDLAEENLKKAVRWPWNTKALLGVVLFRKRDEPGMIKAFETAVSVGKKEGLAWTLYAHCLLARERKDDAVKVLERALKAIPGDGRLEANLELAKEGKKLKTAPYGDKWSRFRLDGDGGAPVLPKAARGFAVRPGFRQKPQRKSKSK